MSGIKKVLYRRYGNMAAPGMTPIQVWSEHTVEFTFPNPGWIAFDYQAVIEMSGGDLTRAGVELLVDGIVRWQMRGAWAWNRCYVWVDSGNHTFKWRMFDSQSSEYFELRNIQFTDFRPINYAVGIEQTTMPKPLTTVNQTDVLFGPKRYQRMGSGGCELEFTINFIGVEDWSQFMADLENFYIIKGDYGVYGGIILPQEVDSVRKGDLILTKCKLVSDLQAGVGVNGI